MKRVLCVLLCVVIAFTASCSRADSSENNITENTSGTALTTTQEIITEYEEMSVPESETISGSTTQVQETTRKEETTSSKQEMIKTTAPQKVVATTVKSHVGAPSVSVPSIECLHKNTVVTGRIEASAESDGYTGDTYCEDCGKLLDKGQNIELVENGVQAGFVKYPCPDGSFITVPVGTNVFEYTMNSAGNSAQHEFHEIENEVHRLFNEERTRMGISSVSNNEAAYYYVKKRAVETQTLFSHTRPDGTNFSGVYEQEGIILCAMAENLVGHITIQEGEDVAQRIFSAVMSSPSHKQTALNSQYNQMTVAVTYFEGQYYFCQHMYDNSIH